MKKRRRPNFLPEPGVVEVVGDVADDRREERVEQARRREDDAGLRGAEPAERGVEEQDPEADDRHRAGAEEIVAAVGEVVPEAGPCASWLHQMNARLNSPSARMAMAWP